MTGGKLYGHLEYGIHGCGFLLGGSPFIRRQG
jgi:hypothetical protein